MGDMFSDPRILACSASSLRPLLHDNPCYSIYYPPGPVGVPYVAYVEDLASTQLVTLRPEGWRRLSGAAVLPSRANSLSLVIDAYSSPCIAFIINYKHKVLCFDPESGVSSALADTEAPQLTDK